MRISKMPEWGNHGSEAARLCFNSNILMILCNAEEGHLIYKKSTFLQLLPNIWHSWWWSGYYVCGRPISHVLSTASLSVYMSQTSIWL